MRRGQQFKIDSIEELKEAYEKLSPWSYTLNAEIKYFNDFEEYRWIQYCKDTERIYLMRTEFDDYETIPNPFKKSKVQRIKDILEDPECEKWEDVEEKDPIREELKALREEVEKLKGKLATKECCNEKPILKEPLFEFMKIAKKEKPKESHNLKIKHISCELTLTENGFGDFVHIILKSNHNECHFCADKDEAIKIVNYLKKHFEIKD